MSRNWTVSYLLLSFFFLFCISVPSHTHAVDCPVAGTVPITADTRPAAHAAGVPDTQLCWNPNDQTTGMDAGRAKLYLNDLPKRCTTKGPECQAPPDLDHIMKLNDTLAICAAKFIEAYKKQYGEIIVSSAFRCGPNSPATIDCDRSENKAAGGATNSNHQLGISMDLNPGRGASYQTMWTFASNNPGFGVCFPHQDGSTRTHYDDPPHLVLAGTGGNEAGACADQKVTKPCDGRAFTPVPASPYTGPVTQNTAPTAALTNMLRGMMSPPPPPYIPSQPVQPYYDPTQYFTPPPPYPTSTPNPPPSSPVPPTAPPPSPTPMPPPPPSSTGTSSNDLINAINNRVGLDVGTKPKIIGTSTVNISSVPQTTFRSDDLNRSPMQFGIFTNKNPLLALLQSLKKVLIKILEVIRPFGKRLTSKTTH